MRAFVVKRDLISASFHSLDSISSRLLICDVPGEVPLRLASSRQQTRIRLALRPEP
jgi:hypothetical protein